MSRKGFAARAGHWSATHKRAAIFGWIAFVVIAIVVGGAVGQKEMKDSEQLVGESSAAMAAIEERGPDETVSESVLIESDSADASDPAFRSVIEDVQARVAALPDVLEVSSPLKDSSLVSEDGSAALVNFEVAGSEDDVDGEGIIAAVESAQEENPGFAIGGFGEASAEQQLNEVFEEDFAKAETLSIPITLLILVIAFGALVAAGIPVLLAISAVMATIGLVSLPSQIFPVDDALSSVVLLIGMAVGIDYSLFYIRREREERARGLSPSAALDKAAATSGKAILVSGLTVIAAMAGMFLSGSNIFIGFGIGTSMVVAVAMLGSLTVLPAMIAWLGDRLERGKIPLISRLRSPAGESRAWGAVVGAVMRRPVISLVVVGGALVALAVPSFGMTTSSSGPEDLPSNLSTIQAYERIQDQFESESVAAEVVVEADSVRSPEIAAATRQLTSAARESGVSVASPTVEYGPDGDLAIVSLPLAGDGQDDASVSALEQLREELIPAAYGATGAEVNVTGETADPVDFSAMLNERLPLVFAFVLGLAFLLMLVTFRSVVVPLVSIALNLLSVGAAYGVLVLVFQDGLGQGLLGTESDAVVQWLPLFLFVILFGLSMDYHVFILSRIRELVDRGMPTAQAVETGIRSTAGTVTAAAVVMVAVFAIFGTLTFIDMKQMGVGLAAAVLIDATVIRGVLLPASLKLLGERTWYLPGPLQRLLPRPRSEPPAPRQAEGTMEPEPAQA
jgi:RND superfamily putative drug exporter